MENAFRYEQRKPTNSLITADQLVELLAERLLQRDGTSLTLIVGGPSGSGKSTLIDTLSRQFGGDTAIISTDNYYIGKTRMQRELLPEIAANFDHPAAIDLARIASDARRLQNGETIHQPVYDMLRSEPSEDYIETAPAPLIIIEGIVANQPAIAAAADLRAVAHTSADTRIQRRMQRDIARKGKSPEETLAYILGVAEPAYAAYHLPHDSLADLKVACE